MRPGSSFDFTETTRITARVRVTSNGLTLRRSIVMRTALPAGPRNLSTASRKVMPSVGSPLMRTI